MATAAHPSTPLTVPAARGTCPFDPPPAYEQARGDQGLTRVRLWDGSSCWMVTRHADIRSVLRDRVFSADSSRAGFPFLSPGRRALTTDRPSFIRMDDPEHARLRRMLTADFMIRKVASMHEGVRHLADELLERMAAAPDRTADLVAEFALPLPSMVICLLLGVPYSEHAFFQRCSSTMLRTDASPAEVTAAQREILDFLTALARERRSAPDDGIISRLAAAGELPDEEIASMGRLLLVAGHETTANMTSLSVLTLLRDPEQADRLREAARRDAAGDGDALDTAVEELLRYLTVVHSGTARVAVEDVMVGGTLVRAGEGVLCMLNAGNRDEDAFPDGGRLDLERPGARRHLAFGFGIHQCLGQPLARLELRVALPAVLDRLPDIRLAAPFESLRFRHEMGVYGLHELPVAW
ncbi:Cytochrome P450 [Actinacidiphila yanglinensis]|uniref:Cytochrome P450 n=1 Tax=Actinacidiphila yanglinensis TaxID=310779 RepID=A0A1H6DSL3_9ACTN|nr:cytochrome P450 [Actinacidiphila yanglinensis]SEG87703.1 Cytochrome P450 [Actinacidiphila yanglinensis]